MSRSRCCRLWPVSGLTALAAAVSLLTAASTCSLAVSGYPPDGGNLSAICEAAAQELTLLNSKTGGVTALAKIQQQMCAGDGDGDGGGTVRDGGPVSSSNNNNNNNNNTHGTPPPLSSLLNNSIERFQRNRRREEHGNSRDRDHDDEGRHPHFGTITCTWVKTTLQGCEPWELGATTSKLIFSFKGPAYITADFLRDLAETRPEQLEVLGSPNTGMVRWLLVVNSHLWEDVATVTVSLKSGSSTPPPGLFGRLSSLPALTTLNLHGAVISAANLTSLTSLVALDVSDTEVTDGTFIAPSSGTLRKLVLDRTAVGALNFASLPFNLSTVSAKRAPIGSITIPNVRPALTFLDLSGTNLGGDAVEQLSFLNKLPNLEYLDLSGTSVQTLGFTPEIESDTGVPLPGPRLSRLLVADNNIARVQLASLHVREIDLSRNRVTALSSLPGSVEVLKLSFNAMTALTIGQAANLTSLDASFNMLQQLGDTDAPNLRALNLASNAFTAQPESLNALFPQLESLNLGNNSLVAASMNLSHLVTLDLAHNRITTVASISAPQLQRLDLAYNRITTFDLDHPLRYLVMLNLTRNRLASFAIAHAVETDGTSLEVLDLSANALSSIILTAEGVSLDNLQVLRLENNRLDRLPALPTPVSSLTTLSVRSNRIGKLDMDQGPLHSLPALTFLDLSNNIIRRLKVGTFAATTELETLRLNGNVISALDAHVFTPLSQLQELLLQNNRLSHIPPDLLTPTTSLFTLDLSNNILHYLPTDLFNTTRSLSQLVLNKNSLTVLPFDTRLTTLANLTTLECANNPLQALPDLSPLPRLEHVNFRNHYAAEVSLDAYAHMPRLRDLWLSRATPGGKLTITPAPEHGSHAGGQPSTHVATVPAAAAAAATALPTPATTDGNTSFSGNGTDPGPPLPFARLHTLEAVHMELPIGVLFGGAVPYLRSMSGVFIGWEGLNEDVLPLQNLSRALGPRTQRLGLQWTGYRTLNFTAVQSSLVTLYVGNNRRLHTLVVSQDLFLLFAQNNPSLSHLSLLGTHILEVSGTNVPYNPNMCDSWGSKTFSARNMLNSSSFLTYQREFLFRCMAQGVVVDISENDWLSTRTAVLELERPFLIGQDGFRNRVNERVPSREAPVVLLLRGAPISCSLELRTLFVYDPMARNWTYRVGHSFNCGCSPAHRLDGDTCVLRSQGLAAKDVVGVAVASVVVGAALGPLLLLWRRRILQKRAYRQQLETENELQKRLIEERDEEVLALKKAWEIEHDELAFVKRIDAGSEGAFGEVWLARWDTMTVAVKVLRQSMMVFDETTVEEFEKEVEFLQRTRHPHVVRFFGAGTTPQESPFLVLEHVALGSLKTLLQGGDLSHVITEQQDAQHELQSHSLQLSGSALGGVDDLGVNNAPSGGAGQEWPASAWALKVRLARDIACGMAFIHSLGHIHRDLKSGNVLVSSRLRAKITDFGSIRQCLMQPAGSLSGEALVSKSRADTAGNGREWLASCPVESTPRADGTVTGDVAYTCGVGGQTLHMTMTAGVGTPLYMAPEVLDGCMYASRADVFSFGVLLWEVATQDTPDLIAQEKGGDFRGPLLLTLARMLREGKRLTPPEKTCEMWYAELSQRCMTQSPDDRPSFKEIEAILANHQDTQP